jgi:hypothetical protein
MASVYNRAGRQVGEVTQSGEVYDVKNRRVGKVVGLNSGRAGGDLEDASSRLVAEVIGMNSVSVTADIYDRQDNYVGKVVGLRSVAGSCSVYNRNDDHVGEVSTTHASAVGAALLLLPLIRGYIPEQTEPGVTAQERHQQREVGRKSSPSDKPHRVFAYLVVIIIFAATITAGIFIYNKTKPQVPKALIPQITRVTTYRKGSLVYIRVHYKDPHHYATGFGFVGINGAGWAEENHSFADPSYGIPGPQRIDYPFNLGCGTSSQSQSDVQFWITDVAGDRSGPVNVHLTCKHWTRVR